MPNFKKTDINQSAFVAISFADQIQPGTFEHTLHYLIEDHIDLSVFHKYYSNDGGGRTAYDPKIMLKIILFAYSRGITSSRDIQWQCENNIIFKALSYDSVPHFTRIAAFVSQFSEAMESVFEQVLLVCDEKGLIGHELFAIDGCKMSSNASKSHSGTFKELAQKQEKIRKRIRKSIAEHKRLDGRKPSERDYKRKLEKEIDSLDQHFKKIDQFLKTQSPRMGQGKKPKEVKSNLTDNDSGKMTTSKGTIQGYNGIAAVDQRHQIIIDAQAYGEGQEYHTLQPVLDTIDARYKRLNINEAIYQTGVVVTADTGYANDENYHYLRDKGINAYVPDQHFRQRDKRYQGQKEKHGKRHQDDIKYIKKVIPSSDFDFNLKGKSCHCPEGNEMWLKNEVVTPEGKRKLFFEGKLTDCRACDRRFECMRNPHAADTREGHGRQVSITYTNGRTAADWMRRRVDSKQGKVYYGHRMSVVEPVFGNIGTNKRLNRFSLRGKKKVNGQWKLFCLVHNIEKLTNYAEVA